MKCLASGFFNSLASFCILGGLALLFSCGYHAQRSGDIQTFTLLPVEGDERGYFGRELSMALIKRSGLDLLNEEGDLIIEVVLSEPEDRNVGFHYERSRKGHLRKELFPIETRLFLQADVTLYREGTCNSTILLEADYTFDHNYNSAPNSVNTFSLGQLTDYDEAYDVALQCLYKKLADKIADWIGLIE